MTGCDHVHIGGQCVLLHRGPTEVLRTEDAGVRWCFGCRAHLPHSDVLLADPPGDPDDPGTWSYYEPIWVRRCSRCNKDLTTFPGRSW